MKELMKDIFFCLSVPFALLWEIPVLMPITAFVWGGLVFLYKKAGVCSPEFTAVITIYFLAWVIIAVIGLIVIFLLFDEEPIWQ